MKWLKNNSAQLIIRGVSIFYLIIISISMIYVLLGRINELVSFTIPNWYSIYVYASFVIYFIGFLGIFLLMRRALVFMTCLTIISHAIFIAIGMGSLTAIITDIIVFSILWYCYTSSPHYIEKAGV